MRLEILAAIIVGTPVVAALIEWAGDVGIAERHHSHHDTYVVSSSFSRALVFAMIFMGGMGLIFGWLCIAGVFSASPLVVEAFFVSFVVVMFAMWLAMRRYRVVTYDDRMDVTPLLGRSITIRYADISAMTWAFPWSLSGGRSLHIMVGDKYAATIWGVLDIEQILQRVNRYDVLENVR